LNRLRLLLIGFFIGNTASHYKETLDLSTFVGCMIVIILGVGYMSLEIAISKKYEQNDTQ
jgi:putative Mn2+ efflux pump MntP